jgi:hypothetical protein
MRSERGFARIRLFLSGIAQAGCALVPVSIAFGASTSPQQFVRLVSTATGDGYWLVTSTGRIYPRGDATTLSHGGTYGCPSLKKLKTPIIGVVPTPDHGGFWEYTARGQANCYGDADFFGEYPSPPPLPVTGMAITPDGRGNALVQSNGAIQTFGDFANRGSLAGTTLPNPIAGIAFDGTVGYWMYSSVGQVYPIGIFVVSYGSIDSSSAIVSMIPTSDSGGYWLAASDGHATHEGDAASFGSTSVAAAKRIVALAVTPDYGGYWELGVTGAVHPHGDAVSYGNGP